jgi:hypothetical protein
MNNQDDSLSASVAAIEAAFDGRWALWLSDTGWWWATRTSALTPAEVSAGRVPHLQASSLDELAERIRQQDGEPLPIPRPIEGT